MAGTIQNFEFASSGGAQAFTPNTDIVLIYSDTTLLTGNVSLSVTAAPTLGSTVYCVFTLTGLSLNGFTLNVLGMSYTQEMIDASNGDLFVLTGTGVAPTSFSATYIPNFANGGVSGTTLIDESVTLAKLADLTAAQIIVGNSSNRPTAVAVTGDVTISNTGVTAIGAGVIVNADVNASAAIARSKLGTGTASHVVINDGSGAFSSEAQLAKSRGGFGQDVSAATGIVKFNSGTLSISSSVESRDYQVSFETGYVGADNTYTLGFDCTLTPTNCSAFVIKAIAATDDAVITLLKNGVAISSGTITFAASSAQDAAGVFGAFSATNFTAGDTISLRSSKPTAGGVVNVTLQFTRNT